MTGTLAESFIAKAQSARVGRYIEPILYLRRGMREKLQFGIGIASIPSPFEGANARRVWIHLLQTTRTELVFQDHAVGSCLRPVGLLGRTCGFAAMNQVKACEARRNALCSSLPFRQLEETDMTRVLAAMFLGAMVCMVVAPLEAWAGGRRYAAGSATCGGPVVTPCSGCAQPVQYVPQTVTRYRQEFQERQVPVVRYHTVPTNETYTYQVQVPVTKNVKRQVVEYQTASKQEEHSWTEYQTVTSTEKRQVTEYKSVPKQEEYSYVVNEFVQATEKRQVVECQTVSKQEEYSWTENQTVTSTEKRQVTEYKTVSKQEEFTYTENVPVTKTEKRTRSYCVDVPTQVTENVARSKTVRVPVCPNPCGPTSYICQTVTEMVPCTRTVVRRETRTQEYECPVTTYNAVQKKGSRTVYSVVPQPKEIEVQVAKIVPVTKKGMRTVYSNQSVTKEIEVPITRCVPATKKATRTIYSVVPETKEIEVQVAKVVPVTKKGTHTVYFTQPVTKEIEVPVTTCTIETRTGTRTRMVCQAVTETVTQRYCVMVPYTETIQVPVAGTGMTGGVRQASGTCCN
jgi:hypothetical protein